MIMDQIIKFDSTASPESSKEVAQVWESVVDSIIKEMFAYAEPHIGELHINLREEMALELAKLISFISERVIADRLNGRTIKEIDPKIEHEQCFSENGREKISSTAKNCAEAVRLKIYNERWKLKTEAALKKEKNKKQTRIVPKQVEENHFIPKSFIKKYWAEGQFVYKNIKKSDGSIEKDRIPVGSWGYRRNLYSDHLEAYFSLLEGDAIRPIQMLLNVEPLNGPQREALIGFIVVQRLRNPHFMESLERSITPVVVSEVGSDKATDEKYMRAVYESLYSQNDFYDKLARPILYSRWVVVRSESPDFVLPDVCNIFGTYDNRQYVVMPLTPHDCLIVLPVQIDKPRVVPHYIKASESMAQDISYVLIETAKDEFLSKNDASLSTVVEEPNKVMHRIILALAKIAADD